MERKNNYPKCLFFGPLQKSNPVRRKINYYFFDRESKNVHLQFFYLFLTRALSYRSKFYWKERENVTLDFGTVTYGYSTATLFGKNHQKVCINFSIDKVYSANLLPDYYYLKKNRFKIHFWLYGPKDEPSGIFSG